MSAAENKLLMQQIFAELAQGNSRPLVESMDERFSWTITGSTSWSKTYVGKQVVLTELLGSLRARIADRIKIASQRFIAEDDLVVIEARGDNTTRTGLPYNNNYCFVFRLEDGKLVEVTEYADTALVTSALGDLTVTN